MRSDPSGMANQSCETGLKGHSSRDLMITIGNKLFLCPTPYRSRSHEVDEVYSHVIQKFKSQPNSDVVDLRSETYWKLRETGPDSSLRKEDEPKSEIPLTEQVPLFD